MLDGQAVSLGQDIQRQLGDLTLSVAAAAVKTEQTSAEVAFTFEVEGGGDLNVPEPRTGVGVVRLDFAESDANITAQLAVRFGAGDPNTVTEVYHDSTGFGLVGTFDSAELTGDESDPFDLVANMFQARYANPPTAAFTATLAEQDLTVNFDPNGATDNDAESLKVRWDWDGDGTYDTDWSTSLTAQTHTYSAMADYPVRLQVMDVDGLTDEEIKEVTVLSPQWMPTATFGATASGLNVNVDASGSTDQQDELAELQVRWD